MSARSSIPPFDSPLVRELADRLGIGLPEPEPDAPAEARHDLGDPGALVGANHPAVAAKLRARLDAAAPLAGDDLAGAVSASLRQLVGGDAVLLCRGTEAAAELAAAIAGQRSGRAIVVEPTDAATLTQARDAARVQGGLVVVDESQTFGRLTGGAAHVEFGVVPDLVCVGASLACGLPFGAVLGASELLAQAPPGIEPPDALALAVVEAVLHALTAAPVHATVAAAGQAMLDAFAAACAREQILASTDGPPAAPTVEFRGQENAEAPLIEHHFQLELRKLGVRIERRLLPGYAMQGPALAEICAALDAATARIRTLLIEHNSYLCGGIPWVFPGGAEALRERGLARYRYPKSGAVDVDPLGAAMRIAFAAGELGAITSSGFYVPTRIRGDFDIAIAYRIHAWQPGPDSACLGLFVQNEASTARYYAQRMSTGDAPDRHVVLAGLNHVLSTRTAVAAPSGELRLTRQGSTIVAWHRAARDVPWQRLGEDPAATEDDVIVGAKIWSKIRCGGIVVDLTDLAITAEVPDEQLPLLESRPDPRLQGK